MKLGLEKRLRAPFLPPNYQALLRIQPVVLLNKNNISLVEPVLDQLLYGDFHQLQSPAYQKQLFQITQLLQLTCQYFALAQDYYAQQAEDLQTKCDTLIS